jgi:hypothetical protein
MYNDDGLTRDAVEKDKYELLTFEANQSKDVLRVTLEANIGKNYSASEKQIKLVIHNLRDRPRQVKVDENVISTNWNESNNRLEIPVEWNTKENIAITVSWNK